MCILSCFKIKSHDLSSQQLKTVIFLMASVTGFFCLCFYFVVALYSTVNIKATVQWWPLVAIV